MQSESEDQEDDDTEDEEEPKQVARDEPQPRYAHRGAMRKAEVEPLTRGWMRARPLEPLSVGEFHQGKHQKIAKTKAPKHSKK